MSADTGDGEAWTARLRRAAGSGKPIDLAPGLADDDSDPADAGEALSSRELPADDIRALLLEPGLRTDPRGLQIRGALVTGTLDLAHAKLPCRLVFTHCRFENAPSFNQSTMPGLVLETVVLPGLSLRSAMLTGDCNLTGLRSTGKVIADNIDVDGQLDLTGAKLSNTYEFALALDGADIDGDVSLNGLEAIGEVRVIGVHVRGQLDLRGAKMSNPGEVALNLDEADIDGVFLNGLETAGEVQAIGVHVRGEFNLVQAKLTNPGEVALNLAEADIGSAFLNGLETKGEVVAYGAHFRSLLDLRDAKLSNPGGNVLTLTSATLDIFHNNPFTADGETDLSSASIRVLSVETRPAQGLPPLSGAHGWTLGTVTGFLRTDRRSAREWLDTIGTQPRSGGRKEFFAQPWKEMAKIYDQIGQPEDARRLRFWAARRTTRVAPWTSKLVRWPYAALVGYGYYPLIVLGWLAGLWLTVLVLATLNPSAFTPTEARASTVSITTNNRSEEIRVTGATPTPPSYPQFDPLLYAVDTAIPAAPTGQSNAWRITGSPWLPGVFAFIKGLAWLLTALLLAGITGILRKD